MHADNDNNGLRFLSVCSGIEAASVAFGPLGWKAVAFSEIEKFPSAVLRHHFPEVPNLGDFTKIDPSKLGRIDILCGGCPCQSFSLAGLRGSLDDARGNLTLAFVRLAHELAAGNGLRNAVYENVVGILSTKDNAFGCFLAGLVGADAPIVPNGKWTRHGMVSGPKGRAAWAVKNAEFFGVAQRRRRVLVVADFGNGADPAAVLFEPEGVLRHPPARGEAGKDIAPTISARTKGGGGLGTDFDLDGGLRVEAAVLRGHSDYGPGLPSVRSAGGDCAGGSEALVFAPEIARCVATREGSSQDYETTTMVAVTLDGQDVARRQCARHDGSPCADRGPNIVAVAFAENSRAEVRLEGGDGQTVGTIGVGGGKPWQGYPCIAFTAKDYGADASFDVSPTLRAGGFTGSHANGGVMPAVAMTVAIRGRDGGATAELGGEIATALRASQGGGDKPHVLTTTEGQEYANADEADASSILSTLREAVGAEAYAQWGSRILAAFQSTEVLRSWLHGQSLREQAEDFRSFVVDFPLSCSQNDAGGLLREVWINGPDGRSPQGRGLAKQLAGKPGEALSVLPFEGTSPEADVQHLRKASEGARLLREALSAIQKVRRPDDGEAKPKFASSAVRRLTARECERLQGFQWLCSHTYPGAWQDDAGRWWSPDYTDIPWRGKPTSPDGPRYKALGNSWAVPKFVWLGKRIQQFMLHPFQWP